MSRYIRPKAEVSDYTPQPGVGQAFDLKGFESVYGRNLLPPHVTKQVADLADKGKLLLSMFYTRDYPRDGNGMRALRVHGFVASHYTTNATLGVWVCNRHHKSHELLQWCAKEIARHV